jgi:hypothetical protein
MASPYAPGPDLVIAQELSPATQNSHSHRPPPAMSDEDEDEDFE